MTRDELLDFIGSEVRIRGVIRSLTTDPVTGMATAIIDPVDDHGLAMRTPPGPPYRMAAPEGAIITPPEGTKIRHPKVVKIFYGGQLVNANEVAAQSDSQLALFGGQS